jgi:hypothetical protein
MAEDGICESASEEDLEMGENEEGDDMMYYDGEETEDDEA